MPSEKWGDFSRAALFDILGAWKDMPKPRKDRLDELRHERTPSRHAEAGEAAKDSGPFNFFL